MIVNLVLPDKPVETAGLERGCASVRVTFPDASVCIRARDLRVHQKEVGHTAYMSFPFTPEVDEVLVYMAHPSDKQTTEVLPGWERKSYVLRDDGRIGRLSVDIDETDYPFLHEHVFNRLAPRSNGGIFYYFPYGYLFRYTGLGPIDPFGFRTPEEFRNLGDREAHHKLILVFGGSAAWSMYSLPDEMFQKRLEAKLNTYTSEKNAKLKFTVVNMGMHGHVVLNEMIAYMLFCERLKPDLVIAHDGFNDMAYGIIADKKLIQEYDICYQYNLEEWSQILHDSKDRPTNHPTMPLEITNYPHTVLKAYLARKRQFSRMVRFGGAHFIWGLQPMLYSKASLAPSEEEYVRPLSHENPFYNVYQKILPMYEKYKESVKELPEHVVDVNEYFSQFGGDVALFGDVVHTLPEGDEKIAVCYFNEIRKMIEEKHPCFTGC